MSATVGRGAELLKIQACLQAGRNVLLEGPVGVGKTHLALAATGALGRPVLRVDGDSRYSEQKLTGWFDPPTVIKKGFTADAFLPGALVEAMRAGGVLFINELNRLPEGVQNVLLPAIDERMIVVPRLGEIRAAPGFLVVATQNPKEFVATSHLSEAILDRFELVVLDYQQEGEELEIVSARLASAGANAAVASATPLARAAVRLARHTRGHPRVRRGASVRAALSIAEIGAVLLARGQDFAAAFVEAALLALPTRIEIEREADAGATGREETERLVREWARLVLDNLDDGIDARTVKKKELIPPVDPVEARERRKVFTSIFAQSQPGTKKTPPVFLPPEAFGSGALELGEDDTAADLASASHWDIATRYHEFKARSSRHADPALVRNLRRLSAQAILERARAVMGSVVHPVVRRLAPLPEVPGTALGPDIDFDETLDNAPLAVAGLAPLEAQDIWMEYAEHRPQSVVLSVDTSLSMTGEKLALTAVALAVVLLQFPEDPIGIVAFENEAAVLKRPDERISLQDLLERFLDVPAQGYTHLEDGLKGALGLVRAAEPAGQGRPPSAVLLTDGKYTAGRDPAYLAPRFPHLVVLKMGKERASLELCRELAQKGHGALREVAELEALPGIMYSVVKDLLRGHSAQ